MTFEDALTLKLRQSAEVSSKTYRVCPNPMTDSKGYKNYHAELKSNKRLSDEEAKSFSNNEDYDVLAGYK